ncbi:hypothetical protein DFQ27_004812 [Actinomortierella ambigua]|uniref:Uncharacterized protein n=1 Tax=Actinomortierella ambigua TaxID=1343610 RepID=A0A9P6U3V9_9FUNG|nr:hypothetical protein DFQ27_004812 [Actinomortierella ambigua]
MSHQQQQPHYQKQQQQQQQHEQEHHQDGAWPRLRAYREAASAIIVEKMADARPLREKYVSATCSRRVILLMVLGTIVVLTTCLFFWIIAAVMAQRLTTRLLTRMRESAAKPSGPQLGYEDGHSTVQHSPAGNSSRGSFEDLDSHAEDDDDEEKHSDVESQKAQQQKEKTATGTTSNGMGPAGADGSRDAVVPTEP